MSTAKRGKKKHTLENALRAMFADAEVCEMRKTQRVSFVGSGGQLHHFKRSVLVWKALPQAVAELSQVLAELTCGCCAIGAVTDRRDPTEAFVVAFVERPQKLGWTVIAMWRPACSPRLCWNLASVEREVILLEAAESGGGGSGSSNSTPAAAPPAAVSVVTAAAVAAPIATPPVVISGKPYAPPLTRSFLASTGTSLESSDGGLT
jgi:hypothetical protein